MRGCLDIYSSNPRASHADLLSQHMIPLETKSSSSSSSSSSSTSSSATSSSAVASSSAVSSSHHHHHEEEDTTQALPLHKAYFGGVCSSLIEGPGIYYMGLIDTLQRWTWGKRLELFFKTYCQLKNKFGISAQPPVPYAQRFILMMRQHLNVSLCCLSGLPGLTIQIVDHALHQPKVIPGARRPTVDNRRMRYCVQVLYEDLVLENWESSEQIMGAMCGRIIEEYTRALNQGDHGLDVESAPFLSRRLTRHASRSPYYLMTD